MEITEHRTASGVFYQRHGDQTGHTALILCHGLASNGSRWQELCAQLDLPSGWCILVPDLRGHGHSTWQGRIDHASWLSDLEQMLTAESIRHHVIGGHCLGANLALQHAARHPPGCLGMILIEPMLPQARRGYLRILAKLGWLLSMTAFLIATSNRIGIYRRHLPLLDLHELDRCTRQAMQQDTSNSALLRRYAAPMKDLRHMHSAAYLQALHATLQPLPPFDGLDLPCLALLSSGGLFGDPARTRRTLTGLPRVEIHSLDAQHWLPTEQPEAMRLLIQDWLKLRVQTEPLDRLSDSL